MVLSVFSPIGLAAHVLLVRGRSAMASRLGNFQKAIALQVDEGVVSDADTPTLGRDQRFQALCAPRIVCAARADDRAAMAKVERALAFQETPSRSPGWRGMQACGGWPPEAHTAMLWFDVRWLDTQPSFG